MKKRRGYFCLLFFLLLATTCPVFALEKSGRVAVEEGPPPEVQFSLALSDFVHNTSFRARPDNTGIVKYRYLGHLEIQPQWSPVALVLDTNFFTDRQASNPIAPSELDWIVALAIRWESWELMAFQETDQSIDRAGLTQKYVAVQLKWSWEGKPSVPEIHTRRRAGTELAQREW